MIRDLAFIDLLYLIAAMRWTLALTAIAFLGGGIVGIVIALPRTANSPPQPPTRSTPVPSLARSGAAACRRSPRRNGKLAPRSGSAPCSSCAT